MAQVTAFNCLYARYRHTAMRRGLSWSLTRDEAVHLFQSCCHYCGCMPEATGSFKSGGNTKTYTTLYNGIDRRDSTRGYEPSNCVPACAACNFAKRLMTESQFISWARQVATYSRRAV